MYTYDIYEIGIIFILYRYLFHIRVTINKYIFNFFIISDHMRRERDTVRTKRVKRACYLFTQLQYVRSSENVIFRIAETHTLY